MSIKSTKPSRHKPGTGHRIKALSNPNTYDLVRLGRKPSPIPSLPYFQSSFQYPYSDGSFKYPKLNRPDLPSSAPVLADKTPAKKLVTKESVTKKPITKTKPVIKSVNRIEIWCDGACIPNPGKGGYGAVLLIGDKQEEIAGGFRLSTNSRMEIIAAIKSLEYFEKPSNIIIYSDSKYLVDSVEKGWLFKWRNIGWKKRKGKVMNIDLWKRLLPLLEKHKVTFKWIPAHSGIEYNEIADALANDIICTDDSTKDGQTQGVRRSASLLEIDFMYEVDNQFKPLKGLDGITNID